MSDKSQIEWTDATWNPVRGCTKVSPGCKNCYAETFAERWRGIPGHAYEQGFDLRLVPEKLDQPLRWTRPRKIFVNSMSDLFHEGVPQDFILAVFAVMHLANRHTFQVLTKRPGRASRILRDLTTEKLVHGVVGHFGDNLASADEMVRQAESKFGRTKGPLPSSNVIMGTSVEDVRVLHRIDRLRETHASKRFLSIEPLLGPLPNLDLTDIDWVIVGGESGPGARPMNADWVREIRDQCVAARVPFFFKQWGGVRKKEAGRDLDGRTWDQMPAFGGKHGR